MKQIAVTLVLAILLSCVGVTVPAAGGIFDIETFAGDTVYQDTFDGKGRDEIYAVWKSSFNGAGYQTPVQNGKLTAVWDMAQSVGYSLQAAYSDAKYTFDMAVTPSQNSYHSVITLRSAADTGYYYGDTNESYRGIGLFVWKKDSSQLWLSIATDSGEVVQNFIKLDAPAGVDFEAGVKVTIYDTKEKILYFLNDQPFAAIVFTKFDGDYATEGTVYNSSSSMVGSFSGKRIPLASNFGFTQRDLTTTIDNLTVEQTIPEVSLLSTNGWVLSASSVNPSEPLSHLLDGDPATHWHSLITPKANPPHTITVELPQVTSVSAMLCTPRTSTGTLGNILSYGISGSLDGETYVQITDGRFEENNDEKLVSFGCNVPVKFLRLTAYETVEGYCNLGELRLYGFDPLFAQVELDTLANRFFYAKDYDFGSQNFPVNADNNAVYDIGAGDYLGFQDVTLDGVRSINLYAASHMGAHADGDFYEVRIDSPTGKVIGRVELNSNAAWQFCTFTAALEEVSGVHDLYFVSMMGLMNSTQFVSFSLSTEPYEKPTYEPVPQSAIADTYQDTWVAHDSLGRALADYQETGATREDKTIGMFYWTWHSAFYTRPYWNNTTFIQENPDARFAYEDPRWPTGDVGYFWDEPLLGYYNGTDTWVLRKHAQMLADAGVDVLFFDCTNGAFSWKSGYLALCEAFRAARADGIDVPKIAFISNFGASDYTNLFLKNVYLSIYKDGLYSDLWYELDGKPLMLAYPNLLGASGDNETKALEQEIRQFFTFRLPQPAYATGPSSTQQWGWLEIYPQHGYGRKADGSFEEVTVGTSVNHSWYYNDLAAMNDLTVMNRAYTDAFGPDTREGSHLYGYAFSEQFAHARKIDPDMIFLTGWNEWTAGRMEAWQYTTNAFPDQFDVIASRDIEPSRGELKDNYYYQMVDEIRKYKGARPLPAATAPKTIDLGGGLAQWADVGPTFYNDKGQYERNSTGYGGLTYTDDTLQNAIVCAKVARDDEMVYFYLETTEDDPNPILYLNTDCNYATGWEGYDFRLTSRLGLAFLFRWRNNDWQMVTSLELVQDGNTVMTAIPKSRLGVTEPLEFEFKWTENIPEETEDIMDFWTTGSSAPPGRYNYKYSAYVQTTLDDALAKELADCTVVLNQSNRAIVAGRNVPLYDADSAVTTIKQSDTFYIPAQLLADAAGAKLVEEDGGLTIETPQSGLDKIIKLTPGAQQISVGTMQAAIAATKQQILGAEASYQTQSVTISEPMLYQNGVYYLPLSFLQQVLGLQVWQSGELAAFGTTLPTEAIARAEEAFVRKTADDLTYEIKQLSRDGNSVSFQAVRLTANENTTRAYAASYTGGKLTGLSSANLTEGPAVQTVSLTAPAGQTGKLFFLEGLKPVAPTQAF